MRLNRKDKIGVVFAGSNSRSRRDFVFLLWALICSVIMGPDLTLASGTQDTVKALSGKSVAAGEQNNPDAAGNVIAAGDGQRFTVGDGGKVTLTSGKSIRLLPGTRVDAGGQMVIKIVPKRNTRHNKKAQKAEPVRPEPLLSQTFLELAKSFRIYPIPESETISLAMNDIKGVLPLRLQVSSSFETTINSKNTFQGSTQDPSLSMLVPERTTTSTRWGERPENIGVQRK